MWDAEHPDAWPVLSPGLKRRLRSAGG
jgi:hypothetical protein